MVDIFPSTTFLSLIIYPLPNIRLFFYLISLYNSKVPQDCFNIKI